MHRACRKQTAKHLNLRRLHAKRANAPFAASSVANVAPRRCRWIQTSRQRDTRRSTPACGTCFPLIWPLGQDAFMGQRRGSLSGPDSRRSCSAATRAKRTSVRLTAFPLSCSAKAHVPKPSGTPAARSRRVPRRERIVRRRAALHTSTCSRGFSPGTRPGAANFSGELASPLATSDAFGRFAWQTVKLLGF